MKKRNMRRHGASRRRQALAKQSRDAAVVADLPVDGPTVEEGLRAHMSRVWLLMCLAVGLTGLTAWQFGTRPELMAYILSPEEEVLTTLGVIVAFGPLLLLPVMALGLVLFSYPVLLLLLVVTAVLIGMSLSTLFLVFTGGSIVQVFFVSSAAFAALSFFGYTTRKELSGLRAMLILCLTGLSIGTLVNLWLDAELMDYVLTFVSLVVFAFLTAHDIQKCRDTYLENRHATRAELGRLAVWSAVDLYLDFLNIFLDLLRLLGRLKKD